MRNLITKTLICFLFIGFIQITHLQTLKGQSNARIEKEIDSAFLNLIQAFENFDITKIALTVDDRHKAGFITNGVYYSQFDSLIDNIKAKNPGNIKQKITIQKKKITVLSDNIALVSAYGDTKIIVDAANAFTINLFWTFVFEKINNEWKVIQSHQSPK